VGGPLKPGFGLSGPVDDDPEPSGTHTTVIDKTPTRPDPGLCRNCRHARRIESDRGSTFLMCKLSFEDSRFVKYPRLPVLACSGYNSTEDQSPNSRTE